MSSGAEEKQWVCGKNGVVMQKVGSMVRDISEPCLSQSPIKVVITVGKMLKPEKWQAAFDGDGKISGFQKVLKLIGYGGVDPSIRAEVWEFLLGCYALGSTAECRRQLRTARRERYNDLLKQCQMMHSSVGTGTLAYVVGSKVMDVRKSYRYEAGKEAKIDSSQASVDNTNKSEKDGDFMDASYAHIRESSSESVDLVSGRESPDSAVYDSSFIPASGLLDCGSPERGEECHGPYTADSYYDFPPLPVTDLFGRNATDKKEHSISYDESSTQRKLRFNDDIMHSFRVDDNADLIIESQRCPSNNINSSIDSEIEMVNSDSNEALLPSSYKIGIVNGLRISDVPEMPLLNSATSNGGTVGEDKVSEWLWTLHRIVVDVVRTDSHLDFYEDTRNLGRMSDILAVYAWVDPATGYCQGMSDLVSPFVVLFEDNADAFWCFEMLIRRMRANFQMEGPTGVMKQLQSLWHILQLTDKEMFSHLRQIGAESLHFAFRMLLVLFRRELSFNDALRMWEMMWAADFDESLVCSLEQNCLEPLALELPSDSGTEVKYECTEDGNVCSHSGPIPKQGTIERSLSDDAGMKSNSAYHFCGLTRSLWSRNDRTHASTVVSSSRKGDDELPVFCVAAILIMNRHKIIKETRSIDDMIKIFNDKILTFRVRRCIRTAIKLRKKYVYKLIKSKSQSQAQTQGQDQEQDQDQDQSHGQTETQRQTENHSQSQSGSQTPGAQNCHEPL